MLDLPFAHGEPSDSGSFRAEPEDFRVREDLGYEPSGQGEHLFLKIEKREENTQWVADNIARQAGVKSMDVGYCGKKDRYAVTTQWFSVYAPKKEFNADEVAALGSLNPDGSLATVKVLAHSRHSKKLRKGEHQSNHFAIVLRDICMASSDDIEARLKLIQSEGVPNYFGEQRFGRNGANLSQFERWLADGKRGMRRNQKFMMISAARAHLFNQILAQRVKDASWKSVDTAAMWGRGQPRGEPECVKYEQACLSAYTQWCDALEHAGLNQERRDTLLLPTNMQWNWLSSDQLQVEFTLSSGQFATALLREVMNLRPVEREIGA